MRSAVSSSSRRSGAVDDEEEQGDSAVGEDGGEGIAVGWDLDGDLSMPDSRRTSSSWFRGGRRYGSHLWDLQNVNWESDGTRWSEEPGLLTFSRLPWRLRPFCEPRV